MERGLHQKGCSLSASELCITTQGLGIHLPNTMSYNLRQYFCLEFCSAAAARTSPYLYGSSVFTPSSWTWQCEKTYPEASEPRGGPDNFSSEVRQAFGRSCFCMSEKESRGKVILSRSSSYKCYPPPPARTCSLLSVIQSQLSPATAWR